MTAAKALLKNFWQRGIVVTGVLRKITKVSRLLGERTYRNALKYRVGAAIEHQKMLRHLEIGTVLDVGANKGQFSLLCRVLFPTARIYAFEPLMSQASIFDKIFECDQNVYLHKVALGAENAKMKIHVSGRPDSSSLLPILPKQDALFPGTAEVSSHEIIVQKGDHLVSSDDVIGPLLIKLDVQGYELNALRGMTELVALADHIYLEISFQELYDHQALAGEVVSYLSARGFDFVGVCNISSDSRHKQIQADALFSRGKSV